MRGCAQDRRLKLRNSRERRGERIGEDEIERRKDSVFEVDRARI
jgi:hypothetical protein